MCKQLLKSNDIQLKYQERHYKDLSWKAGDQDSISQIKDAIQNNYLQVSELTKDTVKGINDWVELYSK